MKKILFFSLSVFIHSTAFSRQTINSDNAGAAERAYLVETILKIAKPVLTALSKNELRKEMPVESSGNDREKYSHLEAFGRLLSGIAPWLELGPDNTAEGKMRKKYIDLARLCLHNATDSTGADYMNFGSDCCFKNHPGSG